MTEFHQPQVRTSPSRARPLATTFSSGAGARREMVDPWDRVVFGDEKDCSVIVNGDGRRQVAFYCGVAFDEADVTDTTPPERPLWAKTMYRSRSLSTDRAWDFMSLCGLRWCSQAKCQLLLKLRSSCRCVEALDQRSPPTSSSAATGTRTPSLRPRRPALVRSTYRIRPHARASSSTAGFPGTSRSSTPAFGSLFQRRGSGGVAIGSRAITVVSLVLLAAVISAGIQRKQERGHGNPASDDSASGKTVTRKKTRAEVVQEARAAVAARRRAKARAIKHMQRDRRRLKPRRGQQPMRPPTSGTRATPSRTAMFTGNSETAGAASSLRSTAVGTSL